MFLTVHATAAVIVAQKVASPWLAFLAGFISHLILDAIPHGDETIFDRFDHKTKIKMFIILGMIDILVGLIWLNFLYQQGAFIITIATLAAILGSIIPDPLNFIYLITKHPWLKWIYKLNDEYTHNRLVKKPLPTAIGLSIQFLIFALFIFYLLL